MQPLSDQLWQAAESTYASILDHPFLAGLVDASLPREVFRHFVVQDSHYLRDYARALTVCAAKAPTDDDVRAFAADAVGAITVEQDMHADFLAALGGERPSDQEVSPTTRAYTSYLLATVYGGSFGEGLAAVLPCYWIYARVGAELRSRSSPDPLYARWISAYAAEEFQSVVDRVLIVTDRVGEEMSPVERGRAVAHFATTARYEWMFWDAAWRRESWPV